MTILFFLSLFYLLFICILAIGGFVKDIKLTNAQMKLLIIFSILSLSCVAFNTSPNLGTDLYRYYIELNNMRNYGLNYVFNESLYHETFISNFFFYLISLTNINGLLPAISTAITLSGILYVWKKKINIFQPSSRIVILYILSFIAIAVSRAVLTGVRQHWAYSVILLALYFDFFSRDRRKKTSAFLYLSSIFIHVGTLPVILVRAFFALTQKYNKAKYLILIWPFLIPWVGVSLSSFGGIFEYAYEKLFVYEEISYPDMRLLTVRASFFVLLIFCGLYISKIYKNKKDEYIGRYISFFLYIGMFGLASLSIPHLFSRIITLYIYMAFPIIILFFYNINIKLRPIAYLLYLFIIFGLISYQLVDLRVSWRFSIF